MYLLGSAVKWCSCSFNSTATLSNCCSPKGTDLAYFIYQSTMLYYLILASMLTWLPNSLSHTRRGTTSLTGMAGPFATKIASKSASNICAHGKQPWGDKRLFIETLSERLSRGQSPWPLYLPQGCQRTVSLPQHNAPAFHPHT